MDLDSLSSPLLADFSSAVQEVQLTQNLPNPFPSVHRRKIQEIAASLKGSLPSNLRVAVGLVLDWHLSDGDNCFPFENFNVKQWIPFDNLLDGVESVAGMLFKRECYRNL